MTTQPRLYFAYGSNLSLAQMKSRCPTSTYYALGILHDYEWIIGERGYANVVPTASAHAPVEKQHEEREEERERHVVYGMLYVLEEQDEKNLDRAEGVPFTYVKRVLDVEIVRGEKSGGESGSGSGKAEGRGDDEEGPREVLSALVYVDEKRVKEGVCKEEYVARMNRGIRDAMAKGMESAYVRRYIRRFVREESHGDEGEQEAVRDPFHPGNREAYDGESL